MSDIITTLHKKGDNTVNVYPNIKNENIPSASITQDKLASGSVGSSQLVANAVTSAKIASSAVTSAKIANGAVTNTKIEDGAVTTSKLSNGAVNNDKLASNSVATSNIINNAVTYSKLSSDIQNTLVRLERTFNFYIGDSDDLSLSHAGTFTASEYMLEFTASEINSAFDFDKNQADYTEKDLTILTEFVKGISYRGSNYQLEAESKVEIINNTHKFYIAIIGSFCYISYSISGTTQFLLQWNHELLNITQYTNTKYIYIFINRLINGNIL